MAGSKVRSPYMPVITHSGLLKRNNIISLYTYTRIAILADCTIISSPPPYTYIRECICENRCFSRNCTVQPLISGSLPLLSRSKYECLEAVPFEYFDKTRCESMIKISVSVCHTQNCILHTNIETIPSQFFLASKTPPNGQSSRQIARTDTGIGGAGTGTEGARAVVLVIIIMECKIKPPSVDGRGGCCCC